MQGHYVAIVTDGPDAGLVLYWGPSLRDAFSRLLLRVLRQEDSESITADECTGLARLVRDFCQHEMSRDIRERLTPWVGLDLDIMLVQLPATVDLGVPDAELLAEVGRLMRAVRRESSRQSRSRHYQDDEDEDLDVPQSRERRRQR